MISYGVLISIMTNSYVCVSTAIKFKLMLKNMLEIHSALCGTVSCSIPWDPAQQKHTKNFQILLVICSWAEETFSHYCPNPLCLYLQKVKNRKGLSSSYTHKIKTKKFTPFREQREKISKKPNSRKEQNWLNRANENEESAKRVRGYAQSNPFKKKKGITIFGYFIQPVTLVTS